MFDSIAERKRFTAQLQSMLRKIKATAVDVDGFARICDVVQLRWLKARERAFCAT